MSFTSDISINPAETGFYYLGSRYYDSEVGRFISEDTTNILTEFSMSVSEGNSMVVKPSKSCKEYFRLLFGVIVFMIMVAIYEKIVNQDTLIFMVVISLVPIVGCWIVLTGITSLHTMIFDEKGCTVQLFKYQRTYRWDELHIKRYESGYCEHYYSDGVFFSVRSVKKSRKFSPLTYCALRHPFTSFFVVFVKEGLKGKESKYPIIHNVEKESFLRQLAIWNVDIENNPYSGYVE